MLDEIDKKTLEIKQDEEKTVYKTLQEIGDDLPDHSPRFVLMSYPLTLVSGNDVGRNTTRMLTRSSHQGDYQYHML